MFDEGEFWAVFVLWLALVTLVGYYVVRIGLMLRQQWMIERGYRLRLAMLRGKAIRERAETGEG
jgi:hypothetical protein